MIVSPSTHRARRQRRTALSLRAVRPAAIVLIAVLCWSIPDADAATAPATIQQAAPATDQQIDATLAALDRLHSYGYTINTPARADRAIRHWQHANRLTVDGHIGPETLASLNIIASQSATATVPADRKSPPTPAAGDIETIIRQAWPDNLEDHAVQVAMRESRLQPEVINSNGDATGLFQIMWSVHRRWLCPELGVCDQSQLQDARTNAEAALALYQRAGGWAPWRLG